MLPKKESSIASLALLVALGTTAEPLVAPWTAIPALAQSAKAGGAAKPSTAPKTSPSAAPPSPSPSPTPAATAAPTPQPLPAAGSENSVNSLGSEAGLPLWLWWLLPLGLLALVLWGWLRTRRSRLPEPQEPETLTTPDTPIPEEIPTPRVGGEAAPPLAAITPEATPIITDVPSDGTLTSDLIREAAEPETSAAIAAETPEQAPAEVAAETPESLEPSREAITHDLPSLAVAGAAAAIAEIAAAVSRNSYLLLEPQEGQAQIQWNIPPAQREAVQQQGGQTLGVRLYDVTDLDLAYQSPFLFQQYDLDEAATAQVLPIPGTDRNYLAEIGYVTAAGVWVGLVRSHPVWIAGMDEPEAAPVELAGDTAVVEASAIVPEPSPEPALQLEQPSELEPSLESALPPQPVPGAAIAGGTALVTGAGDTGAGATAWAAMSGDQAQSDVEASKFNVGQTDLAAEALAEVDAGLAELPTGYGESQIVLIPRDPQWAYAYWDIPNEHREAVRQLGGQRLALRLYDVTDVDLNHQSPHNLQQYDCEEIAREWHIPIPVSDRDYLAELGYLTEDGRWLSLARSNAVRIPPIYPSDWYQDEFLTVDWAEDLQGKTFSEPERIPGARVGNPVYDQLFGMAQSTESLRIAGSLFGSMQQVPGSVHVPGSVPFSPVSSYIFPSGVGMGAVPTLSGLTQSGAGLTMSGVGFGLSGMGLTMSGIGMSGIGMSGVGFSASMPPIRPRKFWLVADAELIVYGATEPDAKVTIGDRPIQLNPDGTFRFQMSFQDGLIDFPILAVAVDGEQNRAIHMKFVRETPLRNTNTKDEAIDEWF